MKDDAYYFHQTPVEIAKALIDTLQNDIEPNDVLYEPFRGEGAFYNNFPEHTTNIWAEIEEGIDYKSIDECDWVITNPPFRLNTDNGQINAFYQILKHFTTSTNVKKGIALLCNDYCLSTLTPKKLREINNFGWFIHKITVCNIKKWRGRYFFIIFKKAYSPFYNFLSL